MSNPYGDFIWYELMSPDPDSAKAFYDAVLGWDIEPRPAGELDYRMIRLPGGGNVGGVLRLTAAMQEHGARPGWLGYVAADDVDATVSDAAAAGARVLMAPWDIAGVGRIAMIADPQGAPVYVMRGASGEQSDAFSPTAVGHCAWNELATSDSAAALDFYTARFGWAPGDVVPMGDMGDYHFLTHHGVRLGAVMTAAPGNGARWRYYFRVADTAAAAERIGANGGTVLHGPSEVPGGDRILIATDPDGAEFALVGK